MDDVDAYLAVLDLLELAQERFDRALHISLQDDVRVLDLAGEQVAVERLERDAAARALRKLLAPEPLGADVRQVLRLALVLDHAHELTCGRRMVESEDLDRIARLCLLDLLPAVVVEGSHLAGGVAGYGRSRPRAGCLGAREPSLPGRVRCRAATR